jgi:bifunctional dethiobiotin synthetase / adenosylmethionine---8-amino-7-oxononanoate aminotransferase
VLIAIKSGKGAPSRNANEFDVLKKMLRRAAARPRLLACFTASASPLRIPLDPASICVWGSNTGVGKTLFSAGLAAAVRRAGLPLLYLKPVQTGFPVDSDARLVAAACGAVLNHGSHAAKLLNATLPCTGSAAAVEAAAPAAMSKVLFAWREAVGPHIAAEREGRLVADRSVVEETAAELRRFAAAFRNKESGSSGGKGVVIVETAGGPSSPWPSGTLQSDALRALRLPGLLVGDGRLGGISSTLCALDSLMLRGHSVPIVALMEPAAGLDNSRAIERHVGPDVRVLAFPPCPPPPPPQQQQPSRDQGSPLDSALISWLESTAPQFDVLLHTVRDHHGARLRRLDSAADDALHTLWWPFTQHASMEAAGQDAVTVVDGRVGDRLAVLQPGGGNGKGEEECFRELVMQFDGCASWWTQVHSFIFYLFSFSILVQSLVHVVWFPPCFFLSVVNAPVSPSTHYILPLFHFQIRRV